MLKTLPPKSGVRRLLLVFGVLAVAGVLMLAFSAIIGLALLLTAEAFFVVAYRRFKQAIPKP